MKLFVILWYLIYIFWWTVKWSVLSHIVQMVVCFLVMFFLLVFRVGSHFSFVFMWRIKMQLQENIFDFFCLFFKEILTAVGVRGATLQHKMAPPSSGWYDQVGKLSILSCHQVNITLPSHWWFFVQQIVDFLNITSEPVLGYAPPTSISTLHLHLWNCCLDYRWSRCNIST